MTRLRRTITAKYPLPACDKAHTPRLDDEIACIVPKGAETHDRYLSKLQQFALDALGAICWLYEGLSSEEGISSTKAKEVLETSIALLGNASAHFSTECRKSVMKCLNKDLRPLCEGKFPDRGPYLFGQDFGPKAKQTDDNIKALKSISFTRDRFSRPGGSNKGKQPQSCWYIWGKGAGAWEKGAHPHQSVFNRLGPAKSQSKTNKKQTT